MKYGDKIIRMEGVIVEVHDGSWNMSFIEQESAEINPRYLETIRHSEELQNEMQTKTNQEDQ